MTKQELLDSIEAGDSVTYRKYAGLGPKGLEYKQARGKAIRYLVQAQPGVVVVDGGPFGNCVTVENIVSVRKKK